LIAMVLGTIIGLVVNPGEMALEDAQAIIAPAEEGGIQLTETEPDGRSGFTRSFATMEDFQERYKKAAEDLLSDLPAKKTIEVTDRRLHIAEETDAITLRYTRRYDGFRIVNTLKVKSPQELKEKYPQFAASYETYADTLSRKVTI